MGKEIKTKTIAVRFNPHSYDRISDCAEMEHRGLGEFVRHAVLLYIEGLEQNEEPLDEKGGPRR